MNMRRILVLLLISVLAVCLCCGCTGSDEAAYRQVTPEEAKQMMEEEEGYIILDVRTEAEYAGGHIPDAVCIPVETIGEEEIDALPDKDQLIMIYCRSGNRSKKAAQKLADKGYMNVVEFGGINDWTDEIEIEVTK